MKHGWMHADLVASGLVERGVAPLAAAGCCAAARPSSSGAAPLVEVGGATATYFDLASVTKPMTAVALARSGLPRDAELASVLPELAGTRSARVTLELLLAHRAGLEAHLPLYEPLTRGRTVDVAAALVLAANARRLDAKGEVPEGGFAALYSDLGYVLVGAALARHAGVVDAAAAVARYVIAPLGLEKELGSARELEAEGVDLVRLAAPTEAVDWRGGAVRGDVHDENAWAFTGRGGSGHAGLFGRVGAVLAFGCAVLDVVAGRDSPLGGVDLSWLVRPRGGSTLRAGFDGKSTEGSSAGEGAGPRAFGHLGFTGTSLWIDPDASIVVSVLTNRVHPTRDNLAIRAARPWAHDLLFARAEELRQNVPPAGA